MSLPLFIERPVCTSRKNCLACRNSDKIRAAWATMYEMPAECPIGLPLGWQGQTCVHCGANWHTSERCPIGATTTPEKERRRAKAGGCCGAASKAT